MAHLIDHCGERLIVESLNGHEGCTVLAEDVDHPPHGHAKWTGGEWVEDHDAKAAADEEARLNRMSRSELLAEAVKRART